MLAMRRLSDGIWGAFDDAGKQIFAIEEKSPECQVCECLSYPGKGRLLVEFFGLGALPQACEWASKYHPPPAETEAGRFTLRKASVVKKNTTGHRRLALSGSSRS